MNKKKIVIFSVVILLFIVILVASKFFYSWWLEERYLGYVPTDEFVIEETESKKIIKHKETKLKMEIPLDWKIEKQESHLFFTSPNLQLYPETDNYNFPTVKKGCVIEMDIIREKESEPYNIWYSDTQARIKSCLASPIENKENYSEEIVKVSDYNALKYTYSPKENYPENSSILPGRHISVKIPKNENIYTFGTYLFSEDREQCEQEFNKFLETVVVE